MRWATAILAALIVIPLLSFFAQSYGTDARAVAPVAIGLILLTGIVILTWLRAPAYNPLYVYLMLAVAACIACLLVRLLMFIPPEVVVSGTIILAVVTAFITWRGRDRIHRERDIAGLCLGCGYDLRASRDRCPECGAPIDNDRARRERIAAEVRAVAKHRRHDRRTHPPEAVPSVSTKESPGRTDDAAR